MSNEATQPSLIGAFAAGCLSPLLRLAGGAVLLMGFASLAAGGALAWPLMLGGGALLTAGSYLRYMSRQSVRLVR